MKTDDISFGVIVLIIIVVFISGCYQSERGHVYNTIQINGSALSRNFSRYYIEYGRGWDSANWSDYGVNLTNNGTSQVNESVLGAWDTTLVSDGNYTIRLSVVDVNNVTSQDFLYVVVDNVFISSPEDNSTIYINRTINITGGAAGVNFQSYVLEYSLAQPPYNWSSDGITLVNNGTAPVANDILGFWNTTNLTGGQHILRLRVNDTEGYMDGDNVTINAGMDCMRITENTTLEGNLTGYGACVIVETDNVLLDCAGHHLIGGQIYGQYSIYLNHTSGVTIRNCVIEDYWCNSMQLCDSEQYSYGIYTYNSSNSTLTNNTVNNTYFGIYLDSSGNSNLTNNIVSNGGGEGIRLYNSSNSTLTNNTVSSNFLGIVLHTSNNSVLTNNTASNNVDIYLISSAYSTLMDNTMENGGVYISGPSVSYFNTHSIDTSNTVNGKPVRYLKNTADTTVPSGAGQVILANVTNVTVENQNLSNTGNGIKIAFSSECTIQNNTVSNSFYNGIQLYDSSNNTLTGNTVSNNNYSGISLERDSNYNTLINNTASNYNHYGISLSVYSNYNTLTGNTAGINWFYGIYLSQSSNNNLTSNNASNNRYFGIYLVSSDNNNLTNNTASNNGFKGIYMVWSDNNDLILNTVNNNDDEGIEIRESSGNNLTSNTASNNEDGIWIQSSNNNTLTGNTASNNTYYGISIYYSNNNTLTGNTASNNTYGIYFTSSSDNTLVSNTFVNNNNSGIFLESSSNYNNLTSNTVSNNSDDGIYLYSSSHNTLTGNTICNNTGGYDISINNSFSENNSGGNTCDTIRDYGSNDITCAWDCLGNMNCGASLTEDTTLGENLTCNGTALSIGSSDITLDCNGHTLTGSASGYGINVTNRNNVTIKNCIVTNFRYGIYLTSSGNNTLTNNTVEYNQRHGLYFTGSSTGNTINNNRFCLNNQSGGNWYDIYDADSSSGDDNTCDTPYNYNDTGTTGCTYLCSVASLNATINFSVNETVWINSSSVNVSLELMTNTSINNTNITLRRYNTSTRSASLSVPSIGKYISIDADEQLSNSLEFVLLRIYYTNDELDASYLNETELAMWWYNSSLDAWQMLNADTMNWVYGTGTNTTEYYVWGNLSHFSDYTIAQGTETQEITLSLGWNLISIPLVD